MSTDEETSTDVQPKKTWLMFRRRQKVRDGAARSCLGAEAGAGLADVEGAAVPGGPFPVQRATPSSSFSSSVKMSNRESRAAPQEAEEHRDSCAAPGAQAAAAESRAAAPHSPRGPGRALLRSLRRGSRVILSWIAAVIRLGSHQPATQQDLRQGTAASTAATAPAAAAQSPAAAPHSPCCPPSPWLGPLEVLGGQGAGAAVGAVVATPEGEEKGCFSPEPDGELDSPEELSQEEHDLDQSRRSGEERPPVRPREAWAEHGNLPPCPGTGQAPALPSRAPQSGAEASISEMTLGDLPPSPSPGQVEARRQWAMAAARILLAELQSKEGDWSTEAQSSSSGKESIYMSCIYEPKPLEPCNGTGLLGLCPQNEDQSADKGEEGNIKELSEEKWDVITIHTIWVNPRCPQLLVEPGSPLEEEGDDDLPSTSRALAAPIDTQPAAAALAGAPEDKEHPLCPTAEAREVAKTAASAPSGAQAAAAESRAVAPHSPSDRGWALLHSLRHGARATLSRITAVIRRRGHQPATQWDLHQGMEAGTAVTAPAAGVGSRAAALHSPYCPPSPSPSPLEALSWHGAGAAMGEVLPIPEGATKACLSLEQDWEVDSPEELSQGERDRDQSRRSGEERPAVRPREAWAEHGNLPTMNSHRPSPSCSQQSPLERDKGLDSRLDSGPLLPQPLARPTGSSQWAGAKAEPRLSLPPTEERSWLQGTQDCLKRARAVHSMGRRHLSWSTEEEESTSGSLPHVSLPIPSSLKAYTAVWQGPSQRPSFSFSSYGPYQETR